MKAGRKRRSTGVASKLVGVRLTRNEHAAITRAAKHDGMTISDFLRTWGIARAEATEERYSAILGAPK